MRVSAKTAESGRIRPIWFRCGAPAGQDAEPEAEGLSTELRIDARGSAFRASISGGRATLDSFLDGMSQDFEIVRTGKPSIEISLRTLPSRPTVMVLDPRLLSE